MAKQKDDRKSQLLGAFKTQNNNKTRKSLILQPKHQEEDIIPSLLTIRQKIDILFLNILKIFPLIMMNLNCFLNFDLSKMP